MYFGPEEEKLVEQYIKTRDEKLYAASIHPLLNKIAYGVRGRYNFTPVALYTSSSVINGCISLLWEKLLTTYNPEKGHKAYSYLSRIAHNYFCGVSRKRNKGDSTRRYVAREVEQIWYGSHNYSESREEMLLGEHHSSVRKRVVRSFLTDYLHSTPKQSKKIFREVDKLPRANKKSVQALIIDTLDLRNHTLRDSGPVYKPVNKPEGATRRLLKVKNKFKERKLRLYKTIGAL
jgi:hypothetical protein